LLLLPLLLAIFVGSAAAQLSFVDESARIAKPGAQWYGVSVCDYDRDGDEDILFVGWTAIRLLRNEGGLTFTDVTDSAGISMVSPSANVGLFADVDNDGWPDLYIGGIGFRNRIYRNLGNGRFRNVSAGSGLDSTASVATAAFGDLDHDGRVDLALATGGLDLLYRNISSGDSIRFQNVTSSAGVAGGSGTIPMQVTFIDYDHNGTQDLFFVHDGFDQSRLYQNLGTFPYANVAGAAGLAQVGRGNSMGVTWFDYNGDGWEDAYVTRIDSAGLFRNNGNGTFTDVAGSTGCDTNGMSWGVVCDDLDNDGDEDIFIANRSGFGGKHPSALLYRNDEGTFTNVTREAGTSIRLEASGVASGDFDHDGRRDLVVADISSSGKNLLLRNTSAGGHWAVFRLQGTSTNRSAIGARLRVVTGPIGRVRTVTAGSSFASQVSSVIHVGLGEATLIDTLEVIWSPGNAQVFTQLPVDRRHDIVEGASLTGAPVDGKRAIPDRFEISCYPNPFNPATTFVLRVPYPSHVRLEVNDLLGRTIAVMADEKVEAGERRYGLDASRLSSGVYVARAIASGRVSSLKLILVR
jgi:hypothetical protein